LKAKQYDTRNPEMGAVSRERDDIVRTHETRAQRRTEISEEVAALKKLVEMYVEATMHTRKMKYLLSK